jgi:hypothetical protein
LAPRSLCLHFTMTMDFGSVCHASVLSGDGVIQARAVYACSLF